MARKVSGLSHRPPIISSRPASMRLAIAISPSRDSSSTEPISRRYMRTGSSVRPRLSSSTLPLGASGSSGSASPSRPPPPARTASASSWSSFSTTWMPISREHRHHVLDLLGGHLVGRQHGVELVEGDVAALASTRDQALDRGRLGVEQGGVGVLLGCSRFRGRGRLRRHAQPNSTPIRTPRTLAARPDIPPVPSRHQPGLFAGRSTAARADFNKINCFKRCQIPPFRQDPLGSRDLVTQAGRRFSEPEELPPGLLGIGRHRRFGSGCQRPAGGSAARMTFV